MILYKHENWHLSAPLGTPILQQCIAHALSSLPLTTTVTIAGSLLVTEEDTRCKFLVYLLINIGSSELLPDSYCKPSWFYTWYFCSSYRRYYNKKSKNWSVCTLKEKKDYSYIPELQRAIVRRRLGSRGGLPRKQTLRPDDPRRLGLLAAGEPPTTSELVQTHVTRGECIP